MLDKIFMQIVKMSFMASIVIAIVLIARLILKKTPKIFSYTLWSVVLIRLICPFSLKSVLSLIPQKADNISQQIVTSNTPNTIVLAPSIINSSQMNVDPPTQIIVTKSINWIFFIEILWVIGILAMLTYSVVSLIKLKKNLKYSLNYRDNIYLAENLKSPFVMGIFHPKIYLPVSLTEDEKGYIILHEQMHIKRFDHIIKIISFLGLCVHWFNPLVWIAFFISGRDMEMSCDESVIKKLGNDVKKDYSTSLLSLATGKRIIGGTPLAFGEGNTKGRIKNILSYKKPTFWVAIICILAVIAVCVGLMTNPKDDNNLKSVTFPEADTVFTSSKTELTDIGIDGVNSYYSFYMGKNISKKYHITSFKVLSCNTLAGNKNEFAIWVTTYIETDGDGWLIGEGIPYDNSDLSKGGICPEMGRQFTIKYLDDNLYEIIEVSTGGNIEEQNSTKTVEQQQLLELFDFKKLDNGDMQLSISNLHGINEFGERNEGFAYYEKKTNGLHCGIITALGQPESSDEECCGSLAGAKVNWDIDIDKQELLSKTFEPGGSDEEVMIEITDERLLEIGLDLYENMQEAQNVYKPEKAFNTIMSSPKTSSNPMDYINAHKAEYEKLVEQSDSTLQYIYTEFLNGNQTDLKGQLMMIVAREILGDDEDIDFSLTENSTPQNWFNAFHNNAVTLYKIEGENFVKDNLPKTYMLIEIEITKITRDSTDDNENEDKEIQVMTTDNEYISLANTNMLDFSGNFGNNKWVEEKHYIDDFLNEIKQINTYAGYFSHEVLVASQDLTEYKEIEQKYIKYDNFIRPNYKTVKYSLEELNKAKKTIEAKAKELSVDFVVMVEEKNTLDVYLKDTSKENTDNIKSLVGIDNIIFLKTDEYIKEINPVIVESEYDAPKTIESDVIKKSGDSYTITFPAFQEGKQDYNAFIYDHTPFNVNITLLEGWSVHLPPESERGNSIVFTPVFMYKDNEYMGYIGFETFELYEDVSEENFYRSVYNQLMLGNVISWDCDYTPVVEDDNFCSATCKVMQRLVGNDGRGAEADVIYYPAIVAYNKDLLVYTAMQFQQGVITEEEQKEIAKSISLTKSE